MQVARRKMDMLFVRGDGVILVRCCILRSYFSGILPSLRLPFPLLLIPFVAYIFLATALGTSHIERTLEPAQAIPLHVRLLP